MSNSAIRRLRRPQVLMFGALVLAAVSGLTLFVQGSWADLKGPTPADHNISLAVAQLLKQQHLSKHPLDDEISQRCMKMFLKTLDPMKVYFTQADIDQFNQQKNDLDDLVRKGDIGFAYTVFQRFLERIDERVKLVDELLPLPQDFTVDEDMITDPDKLSYARTDAEVRDIWRKRIKYDLLVLKSDKTEGQEAIDKLSRRYHSFAKRMHQTDNDELLEMFLTSLTTSYDPHTTYMSPGSLENFEIMMRLNLEGIGAALQFTDGFTVVTNVIKGGAADKDGRLKPKDKVVGVGQGENGEIEDVVDMKLNDVVKKIRGHRGTTVRLKVIPVGGTEPKIYNIVRAQIELKDSEARSQVFEEGKKPDGTAYKVGVINLPSFYMDMEGAREGLEDFKSTTRDVAKLLKKFNDEHVDVVIVDLRDNGGGSLTESINLTGLFIDTGPVVQVKDADNRVQHYDDTEKGMTWKGPLVVITNKFSASASEIFAGAIQDYKRGLVIGDKATHGKGTVQSLLDLGQRLFRLPNAPQLGALKITMQQFYRPSGESTQERGVLADVVLPSLKSQLDVGESNLDYAVKFDRVDKVKFNSYNLVNSELIADLSTSSAQRVANSDDFKKELQRISRYNEQKERKRVSLNEKKFLADRAELNAEKEEEKEFEQANDPDRPVVKRDYYFNEAMNITLDYAKLLNRPQPGAVGRNN